LQALIQGVELYRRNRRCQGVDSTIQSEIAEGPNLPRFGQLADWMLAPKQGFLEQGLVISYQNAPLSTGDNLSSTEAETSERAERADRPAAIRCAERLRCILEDQEPVFSSQF
jgi:hypothetical protein